MMTSAGGGGKSRSLEFELNIVPIIDCLTILVTFLLAAGVYYSVAMLDVKVSGPAADAVTAPKPDITVTVSLSDSNELSLKVAGKESKHQRFQPQKGEPDVKALSTELEGVKARWAQIASVTLEANKESPYQTVIGVMEGIRKTHPDVLLGGF